MRHSLLLLCCLASGAMTLTAAGQGAPAKGERQPAQEPRPDTPQSGNQLAREPMTPEKAKAARTLEATGVANRIGATRDQSAVVVEAYVQARERYERASEEFGPDWVRRKASAIRDVVDPKAKGEAFDSLMVERMMTLKNLKASEREKLQSQISRTVSTEQTTNALVSLETFSDEWDLMVDAIASFGLDAAKQQQALEIVEAYVGAYEKLHPIPLQYDSREAMDTAQKELRQLGQKLNDTMKKILSSEQLIRFEASQQADMRDRWLPTP